MNDRGVLGTRSEWIAGGQTLVLDNAESIFWRDDGDPESLPVTLLHGFPTSSRDWAPIIPGLTSAGFRVISLDLIGFGSSSKPTDRDFSIVDQASVVDALWKRCGVTSTSLVAHDYSVTVAQELLSRDSARITSMTFLNGGVYPALHRPIFVQRLLHSPLGSVLGRFSSERTFSAAIRKITCKPLAQADLHTMWLDITADNGQRIQHKLLRYIDERKQHSARWSRAMEQYPGALQFIWGPEDPISGAHVLPELRRRIPSARFDVLPRVGHYPQLEEPGSVTTFLVDFLMNDHRSK